LTDFVLKKPIIVRKVNICQVLVIPSHASGSGQTCLMLDMIIDYKVGKYVTLHL